MPTGSGRVRRVAQRPQGFTYLWLLFVVAVGAAGLAALAQVWSTASQRDRERELLYRGDQMGRALWSFQAASGVGPARAPKTLQELVEDRRSASATRPLRHLRQIYDDPFTGQPDWVIERDEQQGIVALRSRSDHPALLAIRGAEDVEGAEDGSVASSSEGAAATQRLPRVSDHRFVATAPVDGPASAPTPANAASVSNPFAAAATQAAAPSKNTPPATNPWPSLFGSPADRPRP